MNNEQKPMNFYKTLKLKYGEVLPFYEFAKENMELDKNPPEVPYKTIPGY